MRGADGKQEAMFSYVSPEQRVPADHPLRPIREMVDTVLQEMSRRFAGLYAKVGRPSIPPERLLRALLLQIFYSMRSERLLMEQLNYNLLFRWFVGMEMDEEVWNHAVFSKNRDRLLNEEIAEAFFQRVLQIAQPYLPDEHFTVDGTLIEAWASQKSFRPKEEGRGPRESSREVDFHGEHRSNDTHQSRTDPEARLYKPGFPFWPPATTEVYTNEPLTEVFSCPGHPVAAKTAILPLPRTPKPGIACFPAGFRDTSTPHLVADAVSLATVRRLPRGHWQSLDPPHHCPEEPPRQVTLRQEQPIVPGVLDQTATRFHQPLLQAGERPVVDSLRQHQMPPEVAQVVGDHTQPEPYLVRPKSVAAQPRHLHRLLAFFDPLLRRAALVVEPHHRPAVRLQVGHDESYPRKQLPKVELDLGHHPPRRPPTGCLVEEAFVPHDRLVAWSSHRARQQLRDVPLQAVVGRDADRVLHAPLLQRLVDFWLGEGSVGPKHHLLALLLLLLDFRQQEFFPVIGAVHVARSQLGRQTVTLAIEQQQRVITGGLEVPVVGTLLLLAVDRNLGRVHVQHHPLRGIHSFRPGD